VGVLLGGGVESTLLVEQFLDQHRRVIPIHVHCGLLWDDVESAWVRRFLAGRASGRLDPLIEISLPLNWFLPDHWAVTGRDVPASGSQSARLEIPLRNLTLLGFAVQKVKQIPGVSLAMGTTADNHYPDGSRAYFDLCESVLSVEAGQPIRILTPFIGLTKTDVIRQSPRATLRASFSCVSPVDGGHCGRCIKCGRRRDAFAAAGVDDPTEYSAAVA
jgi:7-cyano-7-deazaguanine synthase